MSIATVPGDDPRLTIIRQKIARETSFFSQWAKNAHWRYVWFNILAITFGALVPIIALLPSFFGGDAKAPSVSGAAGISGAIAALFKAIDGFMKNKENWIQLSDLLSRLRGEEFLFDTRAGQYASATDPVGLLAQAVEGLIERENELWAQTVRNPAGQA